MSLKPTKKSDSGKAWLKGRENRRQSILIHPEYHLIVTEGTKTEPNYFEAIKNQINREYKDRIRVEIEGTGLNTVNLVSLAEKYVNESSNGFKHVWVVYDKDDFPAELFNMAAELCHRKTTENTIYHALWSNQCIELWFLLHFSFYQADIHRVDYCQKLTERLMKIGAGKYEKNREDMFSVLRPYMNHAVSNAKRLSEINEGKTPTESAPGTEVYKIIEMLRPYLL